MFAEVERLHDRLQAPLVPATPTRNLFEFERPRHAARTATEHSTLPPAAPAAATVPAVQVRRTPPYTLIGIAEDAGPNGPVRTAILSGASGLNFAHVGDELGDLRVVAIAPDAIRLSAADESTPLVLTLK